MGGLHGSSNVGLDSGAYDDCGDLGFYSGFLRHPGEKKLKMNNILDHGDHSESTLDDTTDTTMADERYVGLMCGPRTPEQEPTAQQLSAMKRRVEIRQLSPDADFAVWVPFAKKNVKALSVKALNSKMWTMQQDNSFAAKDLTAPRTRSSSRKGDETLREGLALSGRGGRPSEVGATSPVETEGAGEDGHGRPASGWVEHVEALDITHESAPSRLAFLAGAAAPTRSHVDGSGHEGSAFVTNGALHGRGPARGRGGREGSHERETGCQKEEETIGPGKAQAQASLCQILHQLSHQWRLQPQTLSPETGTPIVLRQDEELLSEVAKRVQEAAGAESSGHASEYRRIARVGAEWYPINDEQSA